MSLTNDNEMNNAINANNKKKNKKGSDVRARSLRMFSIGSVVVVCAILLVINLIFDSFVGDKLTWDLTDTKTNSIGSISKDFISKLDKDVEIVGLFELSKDNERLYSDFIPVLTDYEAESSGNIRVRYVDPSKFPSIMDEMDPNKTLDTSSIAGCFIVKCGDKLKVVQPNLCFTYDEQAYYQTGTTVITSNNVEANFTGAISSVTSDIVTKVYFTSNHGEMPHVQFGSILSNSGFEVSDLSTLDIDTIPEDCSLLIINNPQVDLYKEDISLLTDYIANGGNLMIVSDFSASGQNISNLNEVLHYVNLNLTNSRICENNIDWRANSINGYYSRLDPASNFANLTDNTTPMYTGYIRGISIFENPKSYIAPEAMLVTSNSAVLEDNGDPSNTGYASVQNAAMYSLFTGGKLPGEVAVFGSQFFISDGFIGSYTAENSNTKFFRNVAIQLIGEEAVVIQVPVKEYTNFDFKTIPSASVQTFWSIALVAIIPISLMIVGIVVYKKRKNK